MKLVIIEPLGISPQLMDSYLEKLKNKNIEVISYNDIPINIEEKSKRIEEADILIMANLKMEEEVFYNAKKLKFIAVAFQGLDHLPLNYLKERNIIVKNSLGYSKAAVSEQTLGMCLSLLRNLHLYTDATKNEKTNKFYPLGEELGGKKVGIIGTGDIGIQVIKLFLAFNCKVIAYSRTVKKEVIDLGVTYTSLEELLKTSDIISLHVPYNDSTDKLLNKENMNLIKKEAILINLARGKVIDNEYLAYMLNNDLIKGAAIDVYDSEPPLPREYPLLKCKNVILTPHSAFLTKEALIKRAEIVFDNVFKYLEN